MSYYPPENEAGFNSFTGRIKKLIDFSGLTYKEFASKIELSEDFVKALVDPKIKLVPNPFVLKRIIDILDTSLEWIFLEDER